MASDPELPPAAENMSSAGESNIYGSKSSPSIETFSSFPPPIVFEKFADGLRNRCNDSTEVKGMRHESVRSMGGGAPAEGKRAVLECGENIHASFIPRISLKIVTL